MIPALAIFLIVFWLFGKPQRREQFNPYIKEHRLKWKAEKQYREYLKWLDSKGGDVPIAEVKHKADVKAEKEIERHLR